MTSTEKINTNVDIGIHPIIQTCDDSCMHLFMYALCILSVTLTACIYRLYLKGMVKEIKLKLTRDSSNRLRKFTKFPRLNSPGNRTLIRT